MRAWLHNMHISNNTHLIILYFSHGPSLSLFFQACRPAHGPPSPTPPSPTLSPPVALSPFSSPLKGKQGTTACMPACHENLRYSHLLHAAEQVHKKVTDHEVGPPTSPTLTSLVNQAASSPGKAVHSLHACIHAWLSCIQRLPHSCMQSKWKKCCRWLRL